MTRSEFSFKETNKKKPFSNIYFCVFLFLSSRCLSLTLLLLSYEYFILHIHYKPWYSSSLLTWSNRQHGQHIAAKQSVNIEPSKYEENYMSNLFIMVDYLLVIEILFVFSFEVTSENRANSRKMAYKSIHQHD